MPRNLKTLAERVKDFKTEKEKQEAKVKELEKRLNAAMNAPRVVETRYETKTETVEVHHHYHSRCNIS